MSFKAILGNERAIELLRSSMAQGRVAHAYLFAGPEGVGKALVAREFAKALNCERQEPQACDGCVSCRKIDHGTHPDVRWFRPAGAMRMIRVEQVAEFLQAASFKPYEGRWKVFVLVDADRLNVQSQNKVLKTLEEPAEGTVIILTSAVPDALLPTIRSRCQRVAFHPIARDLVERFLVEQRGADLKRAAIAASLGRGSLSGAIEYLDEQADQRRQALYTMLAAGGFDHFADLQAMALGIEQELVARRETLKQRLADENAAATETLDAAARKTLTDQYGAHAEGEFRREVDGVLNCIALWYRDMLLSKETGTAAPRNAGALINADFAGPIAAQAAGRRTDELLAAFDTIDEVRKAIALNVKLANSLEALFLKLGLLAGSRVA
ncbi:MAG: DNA polymerase III subunit delta' [Verrucomicrobia bacterium]|nr:DNA polymerase III subunit delta' [Verrucomicrobiota bacterium]